MYSCILAAFLVNLQTGAVCSFFLKLSTQLSCFSNQTHLSWWGSHICTFTYKIQHKEAKNQDGSSFTIAYNVCVILDCDSFFFICDVTLKHIELRRRLAFKNVWSIWRGFLPFFLLFLSLISFAKQVQCVSVSWTSRLYSSVIHRVWRQPFEWENATSASHPQTHQCGFSYGQNV